MAAVVLIAAGATGYLMWQHPSAVRVAAVASTPPSRASATAVSTPPAAPPTPTQSFATLYQQDSDGVVRIDTVSCGGQGVGTGFLLSPTLVATVNHVIDQAAVISLEANGQHTTGTVIGADPATDLALVQTAQPLPGHVFSLATAPPPVGTRVAAIGFPLGQPITFTQGGISGLDRSIPINGTTRSGLIETDTPLNPGNSGGPLIDPTGAVVGLVDAQLTQANGIAYAVPAAQASPAFATWQRTPQATPPASCADAKGPSADSTPQIDATGPASGPLGALATYFTGINTGDYAAAYAVLGPRLQHNSSPSDYARTLATSFDMDFSVLGVNDDGTSVGIGLAFTSLQASAQGPSGDTCDRWTLDYRMIQDPTGAWRIDGATPRNGSTHTTC